MAITFLFGAGADSVYGICNGASFIEPLLLGQFGKERKELLGDANGQYALLYPQSKRIYFQTIASNRKEAEKVFGKDFTDQCIKFYNKEGGDDKYFSEICKDWYNLLRSNKDKKLSKNEVCSENVYNFFLNHAVFFDSLDEKMNDLRNTPLNSNGKRVINAYATIFILMLKEAYSIPDDFIWSYENVFKLLRDNSVKNLDNKSYYRILKKQIGSAQGVSNNKNQIFVATTNYTEIIEKIFGPNVAYLHGRLNWFEDYQHLTIYDCMNNDECYKALAHKETLMPFILIPSGVKPIICKRQVEEFHKFVENLEKSNILCVLGYKFNSEDNHINSIIAEWLQQENKKLVYFNYRRELDLSNLEWMKEIGTPFKVGHANLLEEKLSDFLKSQNKILDITIGEFGEESDFAIFEETVKRLVCQEGVALCPNS